MFLHAEGKYLHGMIFKPSGGTINMFTPPNHKSITHSLHQRKMLTEVPHAILGENNHTSWAVCMKNYLTGKGLWQIVDGSEPKPNQASDPGALKTWEKHNARALHAIQISCSSVMLSYIIMETTAKAAWDRLASIHRWHDHMVASQAEHPLNKQGTSEDANIPYMAIYNAAVEGAKGRIEGFFRLYPDAMRARISPDGGTALHTAALHRHDDLVKLLVRSMRQEDWELLTTRGATALHIAATGKSVKMAKAMVKKNNKLLRLKDVDGHIPVCIAALYGDKHMLKYLYSETSAGELNPETSNSGAILLSISISVENYSFALILLERFPKLAITRDVKGRICLNVLAQKRLSFPSGSQLSRWQRWIYKRLPDETGVTNLYDEGSTNYNGGTLIDIEADSDEPGKGSLIANLALRWKKRLKEAAYQLPGINYIYQLKLKHHQATQILSCICKELAKLNSTQHLQSLVMPSMFQATESGNREFVTEMIRFDPALLWSRTELGGIFHSAVAQRQEKIWNLIYETEDKRDVASIEDNFDNNILHIAGMLASVSRVTKIPGPAMQMQRELQWFKEVEKLVRPMLREQQNREGKTPRALFSEQHKALANEGKKWMKDTATSCLLVATLIDTVMFEAAIHIPGGSKQSGDPFLEGTYYFQIYATSDAISFTSATVSILMFLSILTSRYAEEDFLQSLPRKLAIGLMSLFMSIVTMMVTFGCTLFINLRERVEEGFPFFPPMIIIVALPTTFFALLHLPLFTEVMKSTFGAPLFNPHPHKKLLKKASLVPKLSNLHLESFPCS